MKHKIHDKLSFKKFLAVTFQLFLPEDCAELITDPRKVFDSFSVFVEPISYQRLFHLGSVFYITAHWVKYYFRNTAHFDLGSTGDRLLSKSITRRF